MVKEKVLAGKYKDCSVVYDHIKYTAGEDIYFNTLTVRELEPFDHKKGGIWEGMSVIASRAVNAGDVDEDQRYISVTWRNGEKSLLQVNTKTYNRIMGDLVELEPKERVVVTKSGKSAKKKKKKSHKGTYILIGLIVLIIVLKIYIFK